MKIGLQSSRFCATIALYFLKGVDSMEFMTGKSDTLYKLDDIIAAPNGAMVKTNGFVHKIRDMSGFAFVVLRKSDTLVQCVIDGPYDFTDGSCIEIEGEKKDDKRAPNGFEIVIKKVTVLSNPVEQMPVIINKKELTTSLDVNIATRPVSLRNVYERAVFKLQEGVARGFREYLQQNGFTEIHTPKIVAAGAEGGANIFKMDYFGKKAFLAQSPQFYKQTMVGVFERVFEVGPVFRAEKHSTTRHMNEYTSLDFEMGFINGFEDIMEMEAGLLQYMMALIEKDYAKHLDILGITLPKTDRIPVVKFAEIKQLVAEKYNRKTKDLYDIDPEEEQLIGKYIKEEYDADFVFVTHYPTKKRPFYAMDDPADPAYTLSFDLLFRGIEITTGGQRIHDYNEQCEKMRRKGLDPAEFENFLMIHKHGMPPHGGLGIGLERLTMKLLDKSNVRLTTLFPRDVTRLTP